MIKLNSLSPQAVSLLERTYKTYPFDEKIENWLCKCDNNEAFLFTQEIDDTVVYAGIVEICEEGLNARFGSGVDHGWDIEEIFQFLKMACNVYGKKKLRLTGRRGWKKRLGGFGFKEVDKYVCKNARLSFIYERDFKKIGPNNLTRGEEDGRKQ